MDALADADKSVGAPISHVDGGSRDSDDPGCLFSDLRFRIRSTLGSSAGSCCIRLTSLRSIEQRPNPFARYSLVYLFALRILVGRPSAAFKQELDDPSLLLSGFVRTAAASPSGLDGKMKRRRACFIPLSKICPPIQQRSLRPSRIGSVQRGARVPHPKRPQHWGPRRLTIGTR